MSLKEVLCPRCSKKRLIGGYIQRYEIRGDNVFSDSLIAIDAQQYRCHCGYTRECRTGGYDLRRGSGIKCASNILYYVEKDQQDMFDTLRPMPIPCRKGTDFLLEPEKN